MAGVCWLGQEHPVSLADVLLKIEEEVVKKIVVTGDSDGCFEIPDAPSSEKEYGFLPYRWGA